MTRFLASRDDVELFVVTQQTARDRIYGYRSALEVCQQRSIPFVETSRVDEALCRTIEQREPLLILCAYYPQIIPQTVIDLASLGCINIHPGILPRYRGRYPTPWYILNGEDHFGIAIHYLEAGIDTGDVLVQETYPISPTETGHELYRRTMDLGADLLIDNFDRILSGELTPQVQKGAGSYYRNIEKRWQIDWNLSREMVSRYVRVHAEPYLPAYTFVFNKVVFINKVSMIDLDEYSPQGGGEIVKVWPDGRFAVSCCDGCLAVEDYRVCPPLREREEELHLRRGIRLG